MELFSKDIGQVLQEMTDITVKRECEEFVNLFFNRRTKGNRAMMLGVSDASTVRDMLTTTADDLINDNKNYLIRIKRTRVGNEKIVFSFNKPDHELNIEQKTMIRELFDFYKQTDRVNLDLAFSNQDIPNLEIADSINGFLDNRHKNIAILSGDRWFSSVTVWTSTVGGDAITSSIEELYIIPCSYSLLANDNVQASEESDSTHASAFWRNFQQKELDNLFLFNFVLLNNINDHLCRIFVDLCSLYQSHFKIDGSSSNLLRRVFFVLCRDAMGASRFLERLSDENKSLFDSFGENPGFILSEIRDAELYAGFLDRVSGFSTSDVHKGIPAFVDTIDDNARKLRKSISDSIAFVKDDLSSFPEQYRKTDSSVKGLKNYLDKRGIDRERFFNYLTECFKDMISFAEKYNGKFLADIIHKKDECAARQSEFMTQSRHMFYSSYEVKDKEFLTFMESTVNYLCQLWDDISVSDFTPVSWDEFTTADGFRSKVQEVIGQSCASLDPISRLLFKKGYDLSLVDAGNASVLSRLSNEKTRITLADLKHGMTLHRLETLQTEWSSVSQTLTAKDRDLVVSELNQVDAENKLKSLLLKKINSLLAAQ
jgi:hypothetical protein